MHSQHTWISCSRKCISDTIMSVILTLRLFDLSTVRYLRGLSRSRVTSSTRLSVRSPRYTECRISPELVHSVNFTSATCDGLTQLASSFTLDLKGDFAISTSGACRAAPQGFITEPRADMADVPPASLLAQCQDQRSKKRLCPPGVVNPAMTTSWRFGGFSIDAPREAGCFAIAEEIFRLLDALRDSKPSWPGASAT
jgi:hypothetical protein